MERKLDNGEDILTALLAVIKTYIEDKKNGTLEKWSPIFVRESIVKSLGLHLLLQSGIEVHFYIMREIEDTVYN